jgi:hypothetical protein
MTTAGGIEPEAFIEVFRRNRFSPSATAAELGIPKSTVYGLMQRHPEIRIVNDVPAEDLRRQYLECGGDLDRLAELLQVSRRGLQLRLSRIFNDALASKAPLLARRDRNLRSYSYLLGSLTLDETTVGALRALLGDAAVTDGQSLVEAVRKRTAPTTDAPTPPTTSPDHGTDDLGDVVAQARKLLRRRR